MKYYSVLVLIICFLLSCTSVVFAGPEATYRAGDIQIALEKLNVLGSVLYIAAHPDDENTSVLAYLSKGRKYRTAYLSLTRGDGGQNLIGPEKGAEIGMIRTQELLEARKIDGAEQFFSRAIDFGYSKNPEETLAFWGEDEILADIVLVIRKFRPDVIITRFSPDGSGGHGHHTASACLVLEAFNAAADPLKYPEQLKTLDPWQTKRLFWNSWRPESVERNQLQSVDVGEYNRLLGASYTEIAALSRSMHKTQGFGTAGSRGKRFEYFQLIAGDPVSNDIFEGIDTSWNRLPGGRVISSKLDTIIENFDFNNPAESIPALLEVYDELEDLDENPLVDQKKKELLTFIRHSAGLWMEAIAGGYFAAPGDPVQITTTLVNRSRLNISLERISFSEASADSTLHVILSDNMPVTVTSHRLIPRDTPYSQPYWLGDNATIGRFSLIDPAMTGMAQNPPSVDARLTLNIEGHQLEYTLPLLFRWTDRVDGELYRPFEIRPPVTVSMEEEVVIFPNSTTKKIRVTVKAHTKNTTGIVRLRALDGWQIQPASFPFSLAERNEDQQFIFSVTPPEDANITDLKAEALINEKSLGKSLVEIAYPHITPQVYFPECVAKAVRLDIDRRGEKIGYLDGAGDDIPQALGSLGYEVSMLDDTVLDNGSLAGYDAIVTGVRAFNTRERLQYAHPVLMEYVRNGGTLVVQYNVTYGLLLDQIGPYPLTIGRERVTVENSPVTITAPDHQLMNFPNRLRLEDFDGWVQERGLYFPAEWDGRYETVIACNDPGESAKTSGILFTRYGEGVFIYTGYSWFRQLPAGVPGAYRLFVNMLSAGSYDEN